MQEPTSWQLVSTSKVLSLSWKVSKNSWSVLIVSRPSSESRPLPGKKFDHQKSSVTDSEQPTYQRVLVPNLDWDEEDFIEVVAQSFQGSSSLDCDDFLHPVTAVAASPHFTDERLLVLGK